MSKKLCDTIVKQLPGLKRLYNRMLPGVSLRFDTRHMDEPSFGVMYGGVAGCHVNVAQFDKAGNLIWERGKKRRTPCTDGDWVQLEFFDLRTGIREADGSVNDPYAYNDYRSFDRLVPRLGNVVRLDKSSWADQNSLFLKLGKGRYLLTVSNGDIRLDHMGQTCRSDIAMQRAIARLILRSFKPQPISFRQRQP